MNATAKARLLQMAIDTAKLALWAFDMAEAMVREFQIRKAREMKP